MCDACLCVMYALCDVCLCVMCACVCDVCVAVCNIIKVPLCYVSCVMFFTIMSSIHTQTKSDSMYMLYVLHSCIGP